MRQKLLSITLLLLFLVISLPAVAEEEDPTDPSMGIVSGIIKVWRTKVKTEGPKSAKDVVVYLEQVGEQKYPVPTKAAQLDQKGLVFIPHALAVQQGTRVDILNSDNDEHNAYFLYEDFNGKSTGETIDLGTWQSGEVRSRTFDRPGVITTLCKLHLEMASYLVVVPSPYFVMAAIDGETQQAKYILKNVPPGKYILKAWHKKLKLRDLSKEVNIEAGKTASLDLQMTRAKYAKK